MSRTRQALDLALTISKGLRPLAATVWRYAKVEMVPPFTHGVFNGPTGQKLENTVSGVADTIINGLETTIRQIDAKEEKRKRDIQAAAEAAARKAAEEAKEKARKQQAALQKALATKEERKAAKEKQAKKDDSKKADEKKAADKKAAEKKAAPPAAKKPEPKKSQPKDPKSQKKK